ncbi:MAG: c-type cytochrome [Janthinobacterium lividum]
MKFVTWAASVVLVSLLLAGSAYLYLLHGANGFSARAQPGRVEVLLASAARAAATSANVRTQRNPVPATSENLQQGMAHYADHCAVCHGNNGAGDTMLGAGMYPKPPDMRLGDTQNKSDGELFSIIENGIRLSGMPAFGGNRSMEDESWKLVAFLRHLPALTAQEEQAMQRMNPKSPSEFQEEKQEEDFLNSSGTQTGSAAK